MTPPKLTWNLGETRTPRNRRNARPHLRYICASIIVSQLSAANMGTIPCHAADTLHSLDQASNLGMVDVSSDYWARSNLEQLIADLRLINPGIVNRFGFFYGGPTRKWIDVTGGIARAIRSALPKALMGAGFPEAILVDYDETLDCGSEEKRFVTIDLASQKFTEKVSWIDMSKGAAKGYYICLGERFLDQGFSLLHFEAPELVLQHSVDPKTAVRAYQMVAETLTDYAARKGIPIYFSGDQVLSKLIPLHAVYVASRFYHTTVPKAEPYKNRIERPGHGIGYSYSLSQRIVTDVVKESRSGIKVFFYIDNWDWKQDDLRRVMELDQENRRYLIESSITTARLGGAYFAPSLEHCRGCVPTVVVGDRCEITETGKSRYDADACGDVPTIAKALRGAMFGSRK